jgi:hypothetical protein
METYLFYILYDKYNQNWVTSQGSQGSEYDNQCLLRCCENEGKSVYVQ